MVLGFLAGVAEPRTFHLSPAIHLCWDHKWECLEGTPDCIIFSKPSQGLKHRCTQVQLAEWASPSSCCPQDLEPWGLSPAGVGVGGSLLRALASPLHRSPPQLSAPPADTPMRASPKSEGYHGEVLYVGKPLPAEVLLQILQNDLCLLLHTSIQEQQIRGRALAGKRSTPSLLPHTSATERLQQVASRLPQRQADGRRDSDWEASGPLAAAHCPVSHPHPLLSNQEKTLFNHKKKPSF